MDEQETYVGNDVLAHALECSQAWEPAACLIGNVRADQLESLLLELRRYRLVHEPLVASTLEDKLAMMVWYLEEVRQHRRGADPRAFESYLDDSEVVTWLDKMNKANRIRNTRFTDKR